MAQAAWMLELDRTRWRLYAGPNDAAPPVADEQFAESELLAQSQRIRDALAAGGYAGEPILIALASTWCLTATLTVKRPQELRDRQTMLYRLEECVPWSAEECVGDFSRAGGKALMVAAPMVPLAEFFSSLEALEVRVQSIVPTALLATAEHLSGGEWPAQHAVAFEQDGWIDLVCVETDKPCAWFTFPVRGPALGNELKRLVVESGCTLLVVGYGIQEAAPAFNELRAATLIQTTAETSKTFAALAAAAAKRILIGELEAPIDLKRGAFGRSRVTAALRRYSAALQVGVAFILLATIAALLYRGHVAGREANLIAAKEVDAFRQVFPNTKVPVGIRSRLESELAKLKGLQGDDTSLPSVVSATTILHGLLAALPTDRRFQLLEIRIEDGRLYVDGEVREHGDAETIAQRLRTSGFEVASPRTQRVDDKRVSLRISGIVTPIAKSASRKSI